MATDPELKRLAQQICGVALSPGQLESFERYAGLLIEANRRTNLTAITDPDEIRVKHFLDSLSCALVLGWGSGGGDDGIPPSPPPGGGQPRAQLLQSSPTGRLADVGAGAGFPSLPLKIAFPALSVTLIESVGKKADFCRRVIDELGLEQAAVLTERAEQVGRHPAHREQYDWAVARAVAELPVLLEYLLPLLKVGGQAIAMKGEAGPAEAQAAERALGELGGRLARVLPVELPGVGEVRQLVVVDKVSPMPERYPRRPGIPAKRPL